MGKAFSFSVKSIQPSPPGSDPQYALLILINGSDLIKAQAVRVIGIVLVTNEVIIIEVEPV